MPTIEKSMSIDPTLPNRLATEATATGGLVQPLQGNDVLRQELDLELDDRSEINPEGVEVASVGQLGQTVGQGVRKLLGRTLSPKDDVYNKAMERLKALEAGEAAPLENVDPTAQDTPDTSFTPEQQAAINDARTALDAQENQVDPLEVDPVDSPEEMEQLGYGPEFDESNENAYKALEKGNTFSVTDEDVKNVLDGIQKPAVISEDGLLSDFRAIGAQGDEKLPDEGRVLSTIEAISQQYKGKIDEAKRGQQTEEATRRIADIIGMTPDRLSQAIMNRPQGSIINVEGMGLAETMLAAKDLLFTEIKKLDELAKKAEFGGDIEAAQFRAQLELVAQLQFNIKGSQTEIARALGSFKIPARSGEAATEAMAQQDLSSMLEDYGGTDDIRNMAKAYNQQATAVHQKAKFAQLGSLSKFGRFSDAMYEAWINILLSSPVTHFKNIVGAMLTTFANVPETYVAAGIGAARRKMGQEGGTTFTQANAQMFGVVMALTDAFAGAGRAFKTGDRVIPGSRIEAFKGKRPGKAFSSEGMEESALATAVDILGNFMTLGRIPTRALEMEDTFFKVIATRMSLYENALSTGQAQGLQGDALANHIADFLYDPPDTAIEMADAHAKYVTLQTDLDPIGKAFSNARRVPVLRYFVPFLKTPYNSFKYVFRDRTPLGLMSGEIRSQLARGRGPGATQLDKQVAEMAIARMAIGSAATLVVGGLALRGDVTGSGPSDRGLQANLRAQGWRPYSIRIPGTKSEELPLGEHVNYMAFEPFTTIFMLGADGAELMMNGSLDDQTHQEIAGHLANVFANQLTDKTFMSGFSDLVSTLNDPTRYAGSTLNNFIRSAVPRIVAQTKKSGVPGLIEGDPIVRNARSALDQIKSQIPGFSRTLPPRRNVFGQVKVLDGAIGPDIFSPAYSSAVGSHDYVLDKEVTPEVIKSRKAYNARAIKVFQIMGDVNYAPKMPGKILTGDRMAGELMEKIELNPEQESRFHQKAGEYSLENMEGLLQSEGTQSLIERSLQGNNLAREILHTQFDTEFRNARTRAKIYMLKEDPIHSDELKMKLDEQYERANKAIEVLE